MTDRLRPPLSEAPDSRRQEDALRKGLGRSILWADRGLLTDESVLLNACLHDQRYDWQLDDTRGDWHWRIIEPAGVKEKVRGLLLASLRDGISEEDADQGCQLALRFSRDGDLRFRDALRSFVADRRFPQCPWLGENELLRLDGESGLVFAARVRGVALLDPGEWFDGSLIDAAVKRLGEERVVAVLAAASETDAAVRRLYEVWREAERTRTRTGGSRQARAERMRAIPVEQVIADAESGSQLAGSFRGWGMDADEGNLRTIVARIRECRDPKVLVRYLQVFSNRACPEFDEGLLSLLRHPDDEVRRRAVTAVAMNSHPSVRDFIEHARGDFLNDQYLELFTRNFRPGDEALIESLLPSGDEHRLHWALYETLAVLERNPQADCSSLAYVIYESTPCGQCRNRAVELLVGRNVAPEWLTEECRWDSEEDTRKLVGGPVWRD